MATRYFSRPCCLIKSDALRTLEEQRLYDRPQKPLQRTKKIIKMTKTTDQPSDVPENDPMSTSKKGLLRSTGVQLRSDRAGGQPRPLDVATAGSTQKAARGSQEMTGAPRFPPAPVANRPLPRAPLRAMKGRSWRHRSESVIAMLGTSGRHRRNGHVIVGHCVSLLCWRSGRLGTPQDTPPSSLHGVATLPRVAPR